MDYKTTLIGRQICLAHQEVGISCGIMSEEVIKVFIAT